MSKIEVNEIVPQSGTTLTLGGSGDTLSIASGVSSSFPSLTVSGDLTVDTNTLYVDSANDRVGIGTTSPEFPLDIQVDTNANAIQFIGRASDNISQITFTSNDKLTDYLDIQAGASEIDFQGRGSIPMLFKTNLSEAMRIDSSGNVGIGTSSPSSGLEVDNANGVIISRSGYSQYMQLQPANNSIPTILGLGGNGVHIGPTNSTGIRIDSSGNVGIGTTSPDLGFGGTYLEVANLTTTPLITIRSDRAGGGALQFGDQDDNNPGYISYQHNNDRMVFRAGDNQQVYIDGAGCMMLGTTTTGSAGNGDLVVNGNIYLGGTGSANALDDYEEGTWTPTNGGNITINSILSATYTKIGRLVTLSARLDVDTTAINPVISGLPFTVLGGRTTASVSNVSTPKQVQPNQVLSTSIFLYDITTGTNQIYVISLTYEA